jgi:FkbM family methyltransferase
MKIKFYLRRKFIEFSKYYIFKLNHLPIGTDLEIDIKYKLKIEPKTIFDVGANYGQTALFYTAIFPKASIYSFEPVLSSFNKLKENTQLSKFIHSYHLALGSQNENVYINILSEAQSQLNSLKNQIIENSPKEHIIVKKTDTFCQENNIQHIDLLKIDTEGFELEVLYGALEMIQKGAISLILCEVSLSSTNIHNSKLTDIIEFLFKYNYCIIGFYETNINHIPNGNIYSNILFKKL